MKASVLHAYDQPMTVIDIDVDDPADDEVLIRVVASGLCHSDKTIKDGTQDHTLPMILGHEASGVVERVGSAVSWLRPGDRVVTTASAFCGVCEWCMRGAPQHCTDRGRTRTENRPPRLSTADGTVSALVGIGGFAEQILVSHKAVAKIPDEMPLAQAALLGCAVITGSGAVFNTAQVRPGQSVAVIGCGGVGLNVIQAARIAGAGQIFAIDIVAEKLDLARTFGATHTINATGVDTVLAVKDLTAGGVDHAFEVVGSPRTASQAFGMLRARGTATIVGVPRPQDEITVRAFDFLEEKRIQGSRMGSSNPRLDIDLLSRLYLDGRLELDSLLSAEVTLEGVDSALNTMDDATGARTIIRWEE